MANMASERSHSHTFGLERLSDPSHHEFSVPAKMINDGNDLEFFFSSTAYRDLMSWLLQLNRSMFPAKTNSGKSEPVQLDASFPSISDGVQRIRKIIDDLSDLIQEAPPLQGPRRFGNVAFRHWFELAERKADSILRQAITRDVHFDLDGMCNELRVYLLGAFGSAQRLDYGTGHELSFLAFLGCLWKLGLLVPGEEQAIVVGIMQPYLVLVRRLILTYTLEPAGSHGVWGLDDHSFLPYIFGSAQLGPAFRRDDLAAPVPTEGSLPMAPKPASVTDRATVADYQTSNMYFSAIQFIYDVKKGPFWEHSPVLYDISGIKDGWGKINKGMLKMYAAEVLGKFPVVQHFPFGSLFRWERDALAIPPSTTIHTPQHTHAPISMDVPPVLPTGTKAPWTTPQAVTTSRPTQMQSGMPSTRAPWASKAAVESPQARPTSTGLRRPQDERGPSAR